jgi:hypothetical protein
MKKYGRKIRKSYFPNLIFKLDYKFSDPKLCNICGHINFHFHNILFWKNFLFNFPKEKQNGDLIFLSKVELFNLKSDSPTREKKIALNFEQGKHEFRNPTNWPFSLELPSGSFTFPKIIVPEFIHSNCPYVNLVSPNLSFLKVKSIEITAERSSLKQ